MNINKEAASAARKFSSRRARDNAAAIRQQARQANTGTIQAAVNAGAGCLEKAGIRDARIEEIPSCAKQSAAGIPMLTGCAGSGSPAVYIFAHIDETASGIDASSCGVAIEALRILTRLNHQRKHPQKRAIYFFLSAKFRKMQMWLNLQEKPPQFIGGLNLDIAGAGAAKDQPAMILRTELMHRPHFASLLLAEAAKTACAICGKIVLAEDNNSIGMAAPWLNYPGGHCSLEQKTDIIPPTPPRGGKGPRTNSIKWAGTATTAFLYMMSRAHNDDLLELANSIRRSDGAAKRRKAVSANRSLEQLKTIETAFLKPARILEGNTPEHYYRAGVNKNTGLWPETVQIDKLHKKIRAQEQKVCRFPRPVRRADARQWRNAADRLVPLAKFYGFPCFEDCMDEQGIKRLKSNTSLAGTSSSCEHAWIPVAYFRGKQTLLEIIDYMRSIGLEADIPAAVKLTRRLAKSNKVSLRPIITGREIKEALVAAGVRKGAAVMLHASLSRFGYIRGGAETIIKSVRKQIGKEGTLIMPAHSLSVLGRKPFQPDSKSKVGAVSEYFRKLKGIKRSAHPTHSVAAIGPKAEQLTEANDPNAAPFDRNGFWGRFYEEDGQVLLMCPVKSATVFHVGETWTSLPQRSCVAHSVAPNGRRKIHIIPNAPFHVGHFEKTMAAPLRRTGALKTAPLGEDEIHCGPAKDMIDLSVEMNRKNPLVSIGKEGRCNCIYCRILKKNVRRSSPQKPVDPKARRGGSASGKKGIVENIIINGAT
ncbi:MAG: AAC(3) family N-acetyltransferase [Verrucomicrobiota bacterium]